MAEPKVMGRSTVVAVVANVAVIEDNLPLLIIKCLISWGNSWHFCLKQPMCEYLAKTASSQNLGLGSAPGLAAAPATPGG